MGKEAVAAVYTGTSVDALTPVPEIEELAPCDYFFSATAGTTYRLAVDGRYNAALGAAEMFETEVSLGYAPANDDFEDALSLADPFNGPYKSAVVAGFRNAGATKQPGEPDHAGNPGGASVWATWTAPLTGSVHLRLCQTDFAALLAVYTGSSVGALTPVASGPATLSPGCPTNPNAAGGVDFNIVAGTTYDIAIDGVDGATGYTNLELWTSDEPVKPRSTPSSVEPPTTKIAGRKIDAAKRTATFSLRSDVAGSTFRCKLDRGAFKRCAKTAVFRHLAPGRHTLRAEAIAPSGLVDKTPAKSASSSPGGSPAAERPYSRIGVSGLPGSIAPQFCGAIAPANWMEAAWPTSWHRSGLGAGLRQIRLDDVGDIGAPLTRERLVGARRRARGEHCEAARRGRALRAR